MKILHCADFHLRDADIEEAEKCLARVIDTAGTEEVDLIVIAGDIFDSRDIKLDSKSARLAIQTVSALADIAPVAIVLGTPSHDGAAPEILRYARGLHSIHVAATPEQIYLFEGELTDCLEGYPPQAVITLIPQPTKQFFQTQSDIKTADQEIGAAMSQVFAGFGAMASEYECPHILVGHWNVKGSKLSNGQTLTGNDIEMTVEQMLLANPDLICLGHIHAPQVVGGRVFYPGSLYANDWGENHPHGFYVHQTEDAYGYLFIETPTKKLARFKFDQTEGEAINLPSDEVAGSVVRIDVTAWQDEAGTIDKESITENLKRWGALDVDIRIIRKPRETVRSETVLKVETLREKLVAMAELKGETVPESVLQKADDLESRPSDELINAMAGAKMEVAA